MLKNTLACLVIIGSLLAIGHYFSWIAAGVGFIGFAWSLIGHWIDELQKEADGENEDY